jgi:hypothetical protein
MAFNSDDDGYSGLEVQADAAEMHSLLNIVHHFFTMNTNRHSAAALTEAMMDGLGYIYYCRNQWRQSTLLMSYETDFQNAVKSKRAGKAVEQFIGVADQPLANIVTAFVEHKMNQ